MSSSSQAIAELEKELHLAAQKGDNFKIYCLLKPKVDINSLKRKMGINRNHLGRQRIQVNINARDDLGKTALHLAAREGHIETMKHLIIRGADVKAEDNDGHTIFDIKVKDGNQYKDVIKKLSQQYEIISGPVLGHKSTLILEEELRTAARTGDNIKIVNLVQRGADVNAQNSTGCSALYLAVKKGHIETIDLLLMLGADITIPKSKYRTILGMAARKNLISIVEHLTEVRKMNLKGVFGKHPQLAEPAAAKRKVTFNLAPVSASSTPELKQEQFDSAVPKDKEKEQTIALPILASASTPELEEELFFAARTGDNAAIGLLIIRGVNLCAQNSDGDMALHVAAEMGQIETIDYFMSCGMDVNTRNKNGSTALHMTIQNGQIDKILQIKTIRHLGTHKIDIEAKATSHGYTALQMAALNSPIEIIACLVELGANLYTLNDSSGYTLLHVAAWGGRNEIIDQLVDKRGKYRMDIHAKTDRGGYTLLHMAARGGKTWTIDHLVNVHGMDIYELTNSGCSALHMAAWKGQIAVIDQLTDKRGKYRMDFRTKTKSGKDILDLALEYKQDELVKHLEAPPYRMRVNSNWKSIRVVDSKSKEELISEQESYYAAQGSWADLYMTLYKTTEKEQIPAIKYFVECRGDINTKDDKGYTILHLVVSQGHLDTLKYLVEECHMDVYGRGEMGYTILHLAAAQGHLDILKYLVEQLHMDVYDRCENGCTSLHLAAMKGHKNSTTYFLEECSMDPYTKTDYDYTIFDIAKEYNHIQLFVYLSQKYKKDVSADDSILIIYLPLIEKIRVNEKKALPDIGIENRETLFEDGVRFMQTEPKRAYVYLQYAYEQGHPLAACYLGILHDVESSINAALYLYTRADSSFPLQQAMLAIYSLRHLKTANGLEADIAANLFQTASTPINDYQAYDYSGIVVFFEEKESLSAYLFLAMVYTRGVPGCAKNKKKAEAFFNKIRETGDAWTWFNIGLLYAKGLWVERDQRKAQKWYELAANKGLIKAQQFLSATYRYSDLGPVIDIEKADRWRQLADASDNENKLGAKLALPAEPPLPAEPLPSTSLTPRFLKKKWVQFWIGSTDGHKNETVRRAMVLYDWSAKSADGLSIRAGQTLYVSKVKGTGGWWWCEDSEGHEGRVPSNCLKELPRSSSSADSSRKRNVSSKVRQIKSTELVRKKRLGAGASGTVYRARMSDTLCALKESIHDDDIAKSGVEKELALMAELCHPNLVMLFGYTHDTFIPSLIMEFMNRGTLFDHLGGRKDISIFLPPDARYSIARNIANGLAYLHDKHFIHRDVKSENVLLCHQHDNPFFAKISDFGLAVFCPDEEKIFRTNELIGTIIYLAPELLKTLVDKEEHYKFNKKTDIYSFAIILWELMKHEKPYNSFHTTNEICEYVLCGGRETIVEGEVPPAWFKLIKDCWAQNPEKRPAAKDIIHILMQSKRDDLPVWIEEISGTSKGKEEAKSEGKEEEDYRDLSSAPIRISNARDTFFYSNGEDPVNSCIINAASSSRRSPSPSIQVWE